MNVTALLWISTLCGGLTSALAAYPTLSTLAMRMDWGGARGALWTVRVVKHARARNGAWLQYVALLVGCGFAVIALWRGGWLIALGCITAGMLCREPLQVLRRTRKTTADAHVADLALVCMAQTQDEKTILQTLDEASVTLNQTDIRRTIHNALERFYNGATESETLEQLLAEHAHGDWALLVWALLEQKSSGDAELGKTLDALMLRRLRLRSHAQQAFEITRRSTAFALLLGVALAAFLILTPASVFYVASLQGQAIGVILLGAWLWITRVWTVQLETIAAVSE